MDTRDYIIYIKNEIYEKRNYDDYVHAFYEYKYYLEKRLEQNNKDIEAICQYSAVLNELRMEEDVVIDLMENLLKNNFEELTPSDQLRLHTNIAGICESGEKCTYHLLEAVQIDLPVPNAIDALGKIYMEEKKYDMAESLFLRATQVSKKAIYRYNYAVALYFNNKIEQARLIFKDLIDQIPNDWQPLYGYAVTCWCSNFEDEFYETLNTLMNIDEIKFDFDKDKLADLYFLCERYQDYNSIYDNSDIRYAIDPSWVYPYLYSLKQQGEMILLEEKFKTFLDEIKLDLNEYMNELLDDEHSQNDKNEYIKCLRNKVDNLILFYAALIETNFKPEVIPEIQCKYFCYMPDCPRCQDI